MRKSLSLTAVGRRASTNTTKTTPAAAASALCNLKLVDLLRDSEYLRLLYLFVQKTSDMEYLDIFYIDYSPNATSLVLDNFVIYDLKSYYKLIDDCPIIS